MARQTKMENIFPLALQGHQLPGDYGTPLKMVCVYENFLFLCSGRPWRPIQNTNQCPIYKEEGQSKGKISSLLPGNAMVQQTSDLCSHPLTGKEGARGFSQAQVPQELNPQLASIKKKNNNFSHLHVLNSRQENITPN